MFEESKLATEIGSFFTKISGYIAAIVFGLFGKIGMEIMMKKKYTWCNGENTRIPFLSLM
jgi:hypothetical protein